MIKVIRTKGYIFPVRIFSFFVIITFSFSLIVPPNPARAATMLNLPNVGTMVSLSYSYMPVVVKGIKIFPDNPLRFDFLIDNGDSGLVNNDLKGEASKLIKYFLASLTVAEDDMWVNLSPYERDRIVPDAFGITEMGRDLLAQDYLLKQLTASLVYPEDELGKKFWERVYEKAYRLYGTTDIPVNTFNKVWILPDKAVVYENGDTAFILDSHLKVMLEEDYLAVKNNMNNGDLGTDRLKTGSVKELNGVSSQVVRDVLIPEIEREVNEGENFIALRQIYNSMIMATWFKRNLRESILGKIYVDQNKVEGIDIEDKQAKEKIYKQYVEAFSQGVYNYIKDEYDPATQEVVSKKYFSGGIILASNQKRFGKEVTYKSVDHTMLGHGDYAMMVNEHFIGRSAKHFHEVQVGLAPEKSDDLRVQQLSEAVNGWDKAMIAMQHDSIPPAAYAPAIPGKDEKKMARGGPRRIENRVNPERGSGILSVAPVPGRISGESSSRLFSSGQAGGGGASGFSSPRGALMDSSHQNTILQAGQLKQKIDQFRLNLSDSTSFKEYMALKSQVIDLSKERHVKRDSIRVLKRELEDIERQLHKRGINISSDTTVVQLPLGEEAQDVVDNIVVILTKGIDLNLAAAADNFWKTTGNDSLLISQMVDSIRAQALEAGVSLSKIRKFFRNYVGVKKNGAVWEKTRVERDVETANPSNPSNFSILNDSTSTQAVYSPQADQLSKKAWKAAGALTRNDSSSARALTEAFAGISGTMSEAAMAEIIWRRAKNSGVSSDTLDQLFRESGLGLQRMINYALGDSLRATNVWVDSTGNLLPGQVVQIKNESGDWQEVYLLQGTSRRQQTGQNFNFRFLPLQGNGVKAVLVDSLTGELEIVATGKAATGDSVGYKLWSQNGKSYLFLPPGAKYNINTQTPTYDKLLNLFVVDSTNNETKQFAVSFTENGIVIHGKGISADSLQNDVNKFLIGSQAFEFTSINPLTGLPSVYTPVVVGGARNIVVQLDKSEEFHFNISGITPEITRFVDQARDSIAVAQDKNNSFQQRRSSVENALATLENQVFTKYPFLRSSLQDFYLVTQMLWIDIGNEELAQKIKNGVFHPDSTDQLIREYENLFNLYTSLQNTAPSSNQIYYELQSRKTDIGYSLAGFRVKKVLKLKGEGNLSEAISLWQQTVVMLDSMGIKTSANRLPKIVNVAVGAVEDSIKAGTIQPGDIIKYGKGTHDLMFVTPYNSVLMGWENGQAKVYERIGDRLIAYDPESAYANGKTADQLVHTLGAVFIDTSNPQTISGEYQVFELNTNMTDEANQRFWLQLGKDSPRLPGLWIYSVANEFYGIIIDTTQAAEEDYVKALGRKGVDIPKRFKELVALVMANYVNEEMVYLKDVYNKGKLIHRKGDPIARVKLGDVKDNPNVKPFVQELYALGLKDTDTITNLSAIPNGQELAARIPKDVWRILSGRFNPNIDPTRAATIELVNTRFAAGTAEFNISLELPEGTKADSIVHNNFEYSVLPDTSRIPPGYEIESVTIFLDHDVSDTVHVAMNKLSGSRKVPVEPTIPEWGTKKKEVRVVYGWNYVNTSTGERITVYSSQDTLYSSNSPFSYKVEGPQPGDTLSAGQKYKFNILRFDEDSKYEKDGPEVSLTNLRIEKRKSPSHTWEKSDEDVFLSGSYETDNGYVDTLDVKVPHGRSFDGLAIKQFLFKNGKSLPKKALRILSTSLALKFSAPDSGEFRIVFDLESPHGETETVELFYPVKSKKDLNVPILPLILPAAFVLPHMPGGVSTEPTPQDSTNKEKFFPPGPDMQVDSRGHERFDGTVSVPGRKFVSPDGKTSYTLLDVGVRVNSDTVSSGNITTMAAYSYSAELLPIVSNSLMDSTVVRSVHRGYAIFKDDSTGKIITVEGVPVVTFAVNYATTGGIAGLPQADSVTVEQLKQMGRVDVFSVDLDDSTRWAKQPQTMHQRPEVLIDSVRVTLVDDKGNKRVLTANEVEIGTQRSSGDSTGVPVTLKDAFFTNNARVLANGATILYEGIAKGAHDEYLPIREYRNIKPTSFPTLKVSTTVDGKDLHNIAPVVYKIQGLQPDHIVKGVTVSRGGRVVGQRFGEASGTVTDTLGVVATTSGGAVTVKEDTYTVDVEMFVPSYGDTTLSASVVGRSPNNPRTVGFKNLSDTTFVQGQWYSIDIYGKDLDLKNEKERPGHPTYKEMTIKDVEVRYRVGNNWFTLGTGQMVLGPEVEEGEELGQNLRFQIPQGAQEIEINALVKTPVTQASEKDQHTEEAVIGTKRITNIQPEPVGPQLTATATDSLHGIITISAEITKLFDGRKVDAFIIETLEGQPVISQTGDVRSVSATQRVGVVPAVRDTTFKPVDYRVRVVVGDTTLQTIVRGHSMNLPRQLAFDGLPDSTTHLTEGDSLEFWVSVGDFDLGPREREGHPDYRETVIDVSGKVKIGGAEQPLTSIEVSQPQEKDGQMKVRVRAQIPIGAQELSFEGRVQTEKTPVSEAEGHTESQVVEVSRFTNIERREFVLNAEATDSLHTLVHLYGEVTSSNAASDILEISLETEGGEVLVSDNTGASNISTDRRLGVTAAPASVSSTTVREENYVLKVKIRTAQGDSVLVKKFKGATTNQPRRIAIEDLREGPFTEGDSVYFYVSTEDLDIGKRAAEHPEYSELTISQVTGEVKIKGIGWQPLVMDVGGEETVEGKLKRKVSLQIPLGAEETRFGALVETPRNPESLADHHTERDSVEVGRITKIQDFNFGIRASATDSLHNLINVIGEVQRVAQNYKVKEARIKTVEGDLVVSQQGDVRIVQGTHRAGVVPAVEDVTFKVQGYVFEVDIETPRGDTTITANFSGRSMNLPRQVSLEGIDEEPVFTQEDSVVFKIRATDFELNVDNTAHPEYSEIDTINVQVFVKIDGNWRPLTSQEMRVFPQQEQDGSVTRDVGLQIPLGTQEMRIEASAQTPQTKEAADDQHNESLITLKRTFTTINAFDFGKALIQAAQDTAHFSNLLTLMYNQQLPSGYTREGAAFIDVNTGEVLAEINATPGQIQFTHEDTLQIVAGTGTTYNGRTVTGVVKIHTPGGDTVFVKADTTSWVNENNPLAARFLASPTDSVTSGQVVRDTLLVTDMEKLLSVRKHAFLEFELVEGSLQVFGVDEYGHETLLDTNYVTVGNELNMGPGGLGIPVSYFGPDGDKYTAVKIKARVAVPEEGAAYGHTEEVLVELTRPIKKFDRGNFVIKAEAASGHHGLAVKVENGLEVNTLVEDVEVRLQVRKTGDPIWQNASDVDSLYAGRTDSVSTDGQLGNFEMRYEVVITNKFNGAVDSLYSNIVSGLSNDHVTQILSNTYPGSISVSPAAPVSVVYKILVSDQDSTQYLSGSKFHRDLLGLVVKVNGNTFKKIQGGQFPVSTILDTLRFRNPYTTPIYITFSGDTDELVSPNNPLKIHNFVVPANAVPDPNKPVTIRFNVATKTDKTQTDEDFRLEFYQNGGLVKAYNFKDLNNEPNDDFTQWRPEDVSITVMPGVNVEMRIIYTGPSEGFHSTHFNLARVPFTLPAEFSVVFQAFNTGPGEHLPSPESEPNFIEIGAYTPEQLGISLPTIKKQSAGPDSTQANGGLPVKLKLNQNYPNPWGTKTTVQIELPKPTRVKLRMVNILGQEVRTITDGEMPAGRFSIDIDGRDLPTGVYFLIMETGDGQRQVIKMLNDGHSSNYTPNDTTMYADVLKSIEGDQTGSVEGLQVPTSVGNIFFPGVNGVLFLGQAGQELRDQIGKQTRQIAEVEGNPDMSFNQKMTALDGTIDQINAISAKASDEQRYVLSQIKSSVYLIQARLMRAEAMAYANDTSNAGSQYRDWLAQGIQKAYEQASNFNHDPDLNKQIQAERYVSAIRMINAELGMALAFNRYLLDIAPEKLREVALGIFEEGIEVTAANIARSQVGQELRRGSIERALEDINKKYKMSLAYGDSLKNANSRKLRENARVLHAAGIHQFSASDLLSDANRIVGRKNLLAQFDPQGAKDASAYMLRSLSNFGDALKGAILALNSELSPWDLSDQEWHAHIHDFEKSGGPSEKFLPELKSAMPLQEESVQVAVKIDKRNPQVVQRQHQMRAAVLAQFNIQDAPAEAIISPFEFGKVVHAALAQDHPQVSRRMVNRAVRQLEGKNVPLAEFMRALYGLRDVEIAAPEAIALENAGALDRFQEFTRGESRQLQVSLAPIKQAAPAVDAAMINEKNLALSQTPGGIDFNPENLLIETKGQGITFKLPIPAQDMAMLPIKGFSPVILGIVQVDDVPLLLGINKEQERDILAAARQAGQEDRQTTGEDIPADSVTKLENLKAPDREYLTLLNEG